jgi:hypothetical protein
MKQKYYYLQMAIENQSSRPSFSAAINTSVEVTTTRGLDELPQRLEPVNPPVVKPQTLIWELLLCFQLLNDLLGYHMAVTKLSELSSLGYEKLRVALEETHHAEMKRLDAEYVDAPVYLKAEAAQDLHTRLRELARAGYLGQRFHEDATLNKAGTGHESTEPVPLRENPENLSIRQAAGSKLNQRQTSLAPPDFMSASSMHHFNADELSAEDFSRSGKPSISRPSPIEDRKQEGTYVSLFTLQLIESRLTKGLSRIHTFPII